MLRDLAVAALAALVLFVSPAPTISASVTPVRLVPDNGGALQEIALHFTPAMEREVAPSYRDLLRALPSSVTVRVVVQRREHFARFVALARRWGVVRATARLSPVEVGHPITTWSRDRYTLARRGAERRLLVRPRPDDHAPALRKNDWLAPFALARELGPSLRVSKQPLIFDGGDLTATSRFVFATALLGHRNRGGELGDAATLRRWLRRATGLEPVLIGQRAEEVPGHHIGMFVTPLDDHTVLVGDARAGLALAAQLPGVEALPLDRTPETAAKFERVAHGLRRRGFRVIRTPLLPMTDGLTYITYNNALLERRAGGALHAYMPTFGVPSLDRRGRQVYEALGVTVHPIDVSGIFRHNGTVRCLVNVLERRSDS